MDHNKYDPKVHGKHDNYYVNEPHGTSEGEYLKYLDGSTIAENDSSEGRSKSRTQEDVWRQNHEDAPNPDYSSNSTGSNGLGIY